MYTFNELKKILKREHDAYPVVRVALLGDTATQFLATAIRGMGIIRGYNIVLFESDYNQVEQQLLDQTSDLYLFDAEYIIVFQSTHKLGERHSFLSAEKQCTLANDRLNFITSICDNLALNGKRIIYLNYPEIDDTVFGSYANHVPHSFTWQVRHLNCGLMDLSCKYQNLFICDIAAIQNKIGRDRMFAPNLYANTEMVLSIDSLPFVASRVMDIICAIQGRFKKCLILDLDNTLWGGVIGDDGLEGIQLGHDLGIGKVFTEFQLWVKKLKERGIILCIASKNNEETAKEPFEKHPGMVLKLDDIAVFKANWDSKVKNICEIHDILNIGYDSMVFLDDNPFERNLVREMIPDITVPELPENPEDYLEYLYSLNLFEISNYSIADKDRTKQYQEEAQRVSLSKVFTNELDYLKSLSMVSTVCGFNKFNAPRVAQLSQRSNQFNLRTVRYTESDIIKITDEVDNICLSFTLEDKFGDIGLISVIIMRPLDKETLFVDTWLMSCRVLNRGMELFVLNIMVKKARERGYKRIIGEYIPTSKNKMVENHYSRLGFSKIEGDNSSRWLLEVEKFENKDCFIRER